MASFNEKGAGSYVNVPANVGAEVRNVSRNGGSVHFEYRAYIYQTTSTWSSNTWALWVEGNQYNVKGTEHSSQGTKYYTPWVGKTVSLNPSSSSVNIGIGVNGTQWSPSSPKGTVTLTLSGLPTASKPSVSGLSRTSLSDKSVGLSFNVTSWNNSSGTASGIQLSLTNFGSVVKSISGTNGTISGLDPNRTYYARGYATNGVGTTYTNVISFTTSFIDPGSPGKPALTYDFPEPIPRAKLTAKWSKANDGSTAVAGYRIRLFKNNKEVFSIDTESTNLSYTFNSFESYGFEPKDIAKVGIYAYSKDWAGNKHFNGGGASTSQVFSDNLEIVSDKYIWISQNGSEFIKHKMYVSQNGSEFKEIRKEHFEVIK